MVKTFKTTIKTIFLIVFYFSISIFLHELFHHLFGVSSEMSLQRNYPLEAITDDNMVIGIVGSLAGPVINLLLTYIGFLIFKFGKNHFRIFGYYLGVTNAFLVISSAIINLAVDLISGSMGNDLEVVSNLLNINIFLLPLLMVLLGLIPFKYFMSNSDFIFKKKYQFLLFLFLGWLIAGLSLMLLDNLFSIRFKIK